MSQLEFQYFVPETVGAPHRRYEPFVVQELVASPSVKRLRLRIACRSGKSFGFRNDCCRRQTSLSIAHRKTYDWVCNNIRERDVRPASILPGLQWIRIPALEERIFALPRGDRALATVPLLFVRTSRMAIQFRGKATRKALAIIDSGETRSHGQRHAA